jgi:hypothetical protein
VDPKLRQGGVQEVFQRSQFLLVATRALKTGPNMRKKQQIQWLVHVLKTTFYHFMTVIFMFGSNWTNFVWSSLFFGMSLCFTGKCPFDKQYSNGHPPFAECVSCFFQWKLRISPLP